MKCHSAKIVNLRSDEGGDFVKSSRSLATPAGYNNPAAFGDLMDSVLEPVNAGQKENDPTK